MEHLGYQKKQQRAESHNVVRRAGNLAKQKNIYKNSYFLSIIN